MNSTESLIECLSNAREYAVKAMMDIHFISELEHLIATAKANQEMNE